MADSAGPSLHMCFGVEYYESFLWSQLLSFLERESPLAPIEKPLKAKMR
jgi:hypothetical protein